jgi:hypothetical protein
MVLLAARVRLNADRRAGDDGTDGGQVAQARPVDPEQRARPDMAVHLRAHPDFRGDVPEILL